MARRAGRACAVAGCAEIAVGSDYCDEHKRVVRVVDGRPSSAARGYGYRWQRLRRMVLARSPLCADPFDEHKTDGTVVLAEDVHHIIPLSSGESSSILNRESNLMPLCHRCHSRITAESSASTAAGERTRADNGGRGV